MKMLNILSAIFFLTHLPTFTRETGKIMDFLEKKKLVSFEMAIYISLVIGYQCVVNIIYYINTHLHPKTRKIVNTLSRLAIRLHSFHRPCFQK